MELAASGDASISQTEQSNIERSLQSVFRQHGDCRRCGRRQYPLHKRDRLACGRRKPSGQARAF
jgi:ribosomal protein S27AE